MSKRTYAPTLIRMLKTLCAYIVKYQNTLIGALTDFGVTDAAGKIAAVMMACEAITSQYDRPVQP